MPQATRQIAYSLKEIAEVLVKDQGIHDGIWGIYVKFGLSATNINNASMQNEMFPAAVVPVVELGIQRFEEANALTVDAAVVNPQK